MTTKRKRITIGSLVLHTRSGHVGLITEHFMWDADWGGFTVKFVKPWTPPNDGARAHSTPPARAITEIQCRADDVEQIS